MKTLEQQIAELTEKHNIQESAQNMFPDLSLHSHAFTYKEKGTTVSTSFKLRKESYGEVKYSVEELKQIIDRILTALPPTKNNIMSFAVRDSITTASPFVLCFDNGVNSHYVSIDYISNEVWVKIELPMYFYEGNEVLEQYSRSVSDSELHYFGGTSMRKIREMNLRAYKLRRFDTVKYYGGNATSYLMKEDFKEEFERIVLTGK